MNTKKKNWCPELDGLRGVASLWVLLGHIAILVDFKLPILHDPGMGVDLFILLSGYLMAKNYQDRRVKEPWDSALTFKKFWLRRFFRIAPLYYFLLVVSLFFGTWFGSYREIIGAVWSDTMTDTARYADHSLVNLLTHISFIFGFIPEYSYRTVLPDWSIGLEMQYYFLFPFIMLFVVRFGFIVTSVMIMFSCLALKLLFVGFFEAFAMPSMILIKLPLFFAGMLLSNGVLVKKKILVAFALLAPVTSLFMGLEVSIYPILMQIIMIIAISIILWEYEYKSTIKKMLVPLNNILNHKTLQFLGGVSYSVYLLHLLVVIPVIGFLVARTKFEYLQAPMRFLLSGIICIFITYSLSFFLYKYIEKPGVRVGKKYIDGIG